MLDLSIHQLAEVVRGQLSLGTMPPLGGDMEPVGRIVTRSDDVLPGDLFWGMERNAGQAALSASEAMLRAAQGTVVAGRYIEPWAGRFSIQVSDAQAALVQLGHWRRRHYPGTVVGVTGAPHRRVTAHLVQQLLQARDRCSDITSGNAATAALSMLNWSNESDFAVLDMGSAQSSEIDEISHLCCPEIIAINSLHKNARHQTTGDRKALAQIHTRFLDTLPRNTAIVVNGDDPGLREAARNSSLETICIGRSCDSDVMATQVCCRDGQLAFNVDNVRFQIPVWGRHVLSQILMAIAIGRVLDVPLDALQQATRDIQLPHGYGDVQVLAGITVVDDSKAASPASWEVGLELLSEIRTSGRRWVVCGDFEENGQHTAQQLGPMLVTRCGADRLVSSGTQSVAMCEAAVAAGMPQRFVHPCSSETTAAELLAAELAPGDAVLVSGNGTANVAHVVQAIVAQNNCAA